MTDAEHRSGRHRPGRVQYPDRSLRLKGRPSWPLSVQATGRHHVASARQVAGLHEQTVRIPQQRRRSP